MHGDDNEHLHVPLVEPLWVGGERPVPAGLPHLLQEVLQRRKVLRCTRCTEALTQQLCMLRIISPFISNWSRSIWTWHREHK